MHAGIGNLVESSQLVIIWYEKHSYSGKFIGDNCIYVAIHRAYVANSFS